MWSDLLILVPSKIQRITLKKIPFSLHISPPYIEIFTSFLKYKFHFNGITTLPNPVLLIFQNNFSVYCIKFSLLTLVIHEIGPQGTVIYHSFCTRMSTRVVKTFIVNVSLSNISKHNILAKESQFTKKENSKWEKFQQSFFITNHFNSLETLDVNCVNGRN